MTTPASPTASSVTATKSAPIRTLRRCQGWRRMGNSVGALGVTPLSYDLARRAPSSTVELECPDSLNSSEMELVCAVAADEVAGRDFLPGRRLGPAYRGRVRAARVEVASAGR